MWQCLDPKPYPRDRRSRPLVIDMQQGEFVYVQALDGVIWVLPDGPHRHPKVLGQAQPAMYAGDLTLQDGEVVDLTNLSGTFQCDDPAGLLSVAERLEDIGFLVLPGAVRFFPMDGGRPIVLR